MFRTTAHVYDLVYEFGGKDYQAESATLVRQIEERVPTARTLLDVACGTGGHLVLLKDHFEVLGVDLDANMLAEARRRLPDIEFVESDMRYLDAARRFVLMTSSRRDRDTPHGGLGALDAQPRPSLRRAFGTTWNSPPGGPGTGGPPPTAPGSGHGRAHRG